MPNPFDTIAALATPVGTAALAVVRISGQDTQRLVAGLAGRPPPPRHPVYLDYRDRAGGLVDDVLLTYFAGPRSYTGEDAAEISCHGNPFIAQKILEDLFARGCRPAEPGEFTQRAFLHGKMDLTQAEAVMDLIHARSDCALAAAQDQLRGALGRRMGELVDALLSVLARVEAYIDFPDEDLPSEDRSWIQSELQKITNETGRLLATSHYGQILRDGIKTVIVGQPNAGKSSLLNRLVGRPRALVSSEPGTTRDFIEERIVLGPHCLRLIDTAGLNPSPSGLEKLGIENTREQLSAADLVLLVVDRSEAGTLLLMPDEVPLERTILVLNKSDITLTSHLPGAWRMSKIPTVNLSALTGVGLDQLRGDITRLADKFQQKVGSDHIAVNARHAHAMREARAGLESALAKVVDHGPTELLASDLRSVLGALGEITGKVDNEQMLDHLFATFCIGK